MDDKNYKSEFDSAYEKGRSSQIITEEFNGIEHALVPNDCSLKSLEHLMPAPVRIKAHPEFFDVESFQSYIKDFKEDGSRIFVNDDAWSFVTVFDAPSKGKPAHCDHSASMKVERSSEWKRFCNFDNEKMSPMDFAEFIEDNIDYISAEKMTAGDLLTMAQTFKITVKGDVDVSETLSGGLKHLVIKDDSTLKAQNDKGKSVSFPEKLKLKIRIFKNQETFDLSVHLRHRTSTTGVMFWIKIPDISGIEEQAFNAVMARVEKVTKLPTLKGKFDGPNHRR